MRANLHASSFNPQIERYLDSVKIYSVESLKLADLKSVLGTEEARFTRLGRISGRLEYSVAGDIVSFWPLGYRHPIRIEYFGETPEKSYVYDELYGRKIANITELIIGTQTPPEKVDQEAIIVTDATQKHGAGFFPAFVNFITDYAEDTELATITSYDFSYPPLMWNRFDLLETEVKRLRDSDYKVLIQTQHWNSLPEDIRRNLSHKEDHKLFELLPPDLPAGFISAKEKAAVFTDREIFGTILLTRRKEKLDSSQTAKLLRQFEGEISVGDYVVHESYGVAKYAGLTQEEIDNQMWEYLQLDFAGEDKLLVPIDQIGKLTRFIGDDGVTPKLSRLGKQEWENVTKRVKNSIGILAKELIQHYAERQMSVSMTIDETDSAEYERFVSEFEYTETEDQLRSTNEIIADMQSPTPMNRLLIGDVGFGKTEVIMRAAFKAVEAGMQVAILAPTTILASQHYAVFKERFKGFDVKIASMSRFNSNSENKQIAEKISTNNIDIAIGTHRLLSNDIQFKKLGLLVVDEEQRFGVGQKEKIKKFNKSVHYLSASATPIPRTMSMALSTIQEISIMTTPPGGRKPIHTELVRDDWAKIANAIMFEINRGGQVYVIHNRVQTIAAVKARLLELIPNARIVIGHGQMPSDQLDTVMSDFYEHKYDILLATTIIENGLDMPNVNTIVINRAHTFGLSQLYQLRGRVGRSEKQAFAYLFYEGRDLKKPETEAEKKLVAKDYLRRLESLVEASELGAGFQIASRDLEIRGAGSILGSKQHGHISTVGYALYMQLLAQEIERLKAIGNFEETEYTSF